MAVTINADNGVSSGSAGLKQTADSTGVLALQTNGTTAVTIATSQNVGIGNTTVRNKLDVVGNTGIYSTGATSVGSPLGAQVYIGDSNYNTASYYNAAPGFGAVYDATYASAAALAFYTYAGTPNARSERMRIDASGNVGIGTSSPAYKLDVSATSFIAASVSTSYSGAGNIRIADASTTSGSAPYIGSVGNNLTFGRIGTAEYMRIDSSGNVGVNNTNPTQYATSGKVLNLTGTATNSGPANLYLSGSSSVLGRGFNSTEVFAIANITSASEITRITGSGANGYRAYFKIIVTGHTAGVDNGINIKEYYWDGSTTAPVQISTYTAGTGVPVISFDNSTTQVCIIKLASSNGTSGFNGVMKVEWMIPVDFSSNTWTIS